MPCTEPSHRHHQSGFSHEASSGCTPYLYFVSVRATTLVSRPPCLLLVLLACLGIVPNGSDIDHQDHSGAIHGVDGECHRREASLFALTCSWVMVGIRLLQSPLSNGRLLMFYEYIWQGDEAVP